MPSKPDPPNRKPITDDHDSPWKHALELYFPQALALLTPNVHKAIDWAIPAEFLDKELQAIAIPSKKGRRLVDKLAQVRLRDGTDAWLLIHVEVERRLDGQQALKTFAWRLYEYRFRIQSRIMQQRRLTLPPKIYSLGILLESKGLGHDIFHTDEYQGQGVRFRFPVVELETWRSRWDELKSLAPSNPFAVVVMAQLQANHYRDKYTRLIEWMIALPEDLELDFLQAVDALSKENEMTYVTLIERAGRDKWFAEGQAEGQAKGRAEGKKEGSLEGQAQFLLRLVQRRFGPQPDDINQRIRTATAAQLETWSLNFVDATELDDVFRA